MKSLWKHDFKKILSLDYVEVCIATCLNALIVAVTVIDRSKIFYSAFISMSIAITLTLLLVILTERFSSRIETQKGNRDLIKVIILEVVLLFGLPLLPPTTNILFLSFEILLVIGAECFSLFLFWKAFAIELTELFIFIGLSMKLLPQIISRQASHLFSKIKAGRVRIPDSHVLNLFSIKKTKHS